jgi:hypothetical protein
MNNYLKNPPPVYNRFINNQILTESQLNSVLNHLNYQDKATRAQLVGVGIVCGLEVSMTENHIHLTKGVGITTDGDLISMEQSEFSGFRRFGDSNARYSRFIRNGNTISLWELIQDTEASDTEPLEAFGGTAGFGLNDAIALIYLEYYHREPEDCSPVDCNSQGKEVVNQPRVLLISAEDAEQILQNDPIHSGWLDEKLESVGKKLKPVHVQRVVHSGKSQTLNQFIRSYAVEFKGIIDQTELLGNLPLFRDVFEEINVNLSGKLYGLQETEYNYQYLYDFYRDLADQLNEISGFLRQNISLCMPDSTAFPKHLFLGGFRQTARHFRHDYHPSPALNYPVQPERLRSAFERLLLMIHDFSPALKQEVRITPSRPNNHPLKKRAIPFYYNLESSSDPDRFLKQWRSGRVDPVPNYYRINGNSSIDPLDIHLEGHDFFRVEGHAGNSISNVLTKIKEIKTEKGLAFKTLPVSIDREVIEETIDTEQYRAYFEDLQAILDAWNREQECLIKQVTRFLSGFSMEEPGKHLHYAVKGSASGMTLRDRGTGPQRNVDPVFSSVTGRQFAGTPLITERRNVVMDQFIDEKGYIGELFHKHVNTRDSRNDIRVKMQEVTAEFSEQMGPDLAWAAAQFPVEVVGTLKEIEDHRIDDVRQATGEKMDQFDQLLRIFCQQIHTGQMKYRQMLRKESSTLASFEWSEAYSHILHSLTMLCCIPEKMKSLREKIERRKRELFKRFTLTEFIQQHPGAEHFAGVPKGGTFIILYTTGQSKTKIARGTVVGDLCLPYICCSDAPSVTFVIPDDEAELDIPVDHICMKKDEPADPVKLDVTPATGTVRALIDDKEYEAAIVLEDNNILFDPNAIPESDYGKTIRFTVNGIRVEPVLTLYEKPDPVFSIGESIEFSEDRTSAEVNFQNNTPNRESFTFEWNFGDGQKLENSEEHITHKYSVAPGNEIKFSIELKADNGPCLAATIEDLQLKVPERDESNTETQCREFASDQIRRSLEENLAMLRSNMPSLNNFNEFINGSLRPFYESVLEQMDQALNGELDEKINEFIFNYMQVVQHSLQNQSEQEQVYSLYIYYEVILLHLYIRGCREEKIDRFSRPSDAVLGWVDFTRTVQDSMPDILKELLQTTAIHEKFKTAFKKYEKKFSEQLHKEMEEIFNIIQEMS